MADQIGTGVTAIEYERPKRAATSGVSAASRAKSSAWGSLTGGNGDKTYHHNQSTPSDVWEITHNLDKYPSVTTTDSAGTVVEGEVDYIDKNKLTVSFSAPFSGSADLN